MEKGHFFGSKLNEKAKEVPQMTAVGFESQRCVDLLWFYDSRPESLIKQVCPEKS